MRPTHAEIDLSAITFNLRNIHNKVAPAQIMAVVKANAYGHGVHEVAKTALNSGASYLGVALIEEGIELREFGINASILVFGGEIESQIDELIHHDLEISLFTKSVANTLSKIALRENRQAKVHIKIDTGMGRVGVPWDQAVDFIVDVHKFKGIEIIGIYTHFATSDERDKSYANLQLSRFNNVIAELESKGIKIPLKHAANSGAIIDMPHSYFDMVRPGIMMYGYYPSNETTESVSLKPAMTFKSKVSFIKEVAERTGVSYGRTYITPKRTRIATIPVGYADGYNRLLSNKAQVIIQGKLFPIVGRVCMDLILVDIGNDKDIKIGDDVILFGKQGDVEFSVYEICNMISTIPYEVCCWISGRVPRIYKG